MSGKSLVFDPYIYSRLGIRAVFVNHILFNFFQGSIWVCIIEISTLIEKETPECYNFNVKSSNIKHFV